MYEIRRKNRYKIYIQNQCRFKPAVTLFNILYIKCFWFVQGSYRTEFLDGHTCGCVFIGGKWALTAAHCGGWVNTHIIAYKESNLNSISL